MPSGGEAKYISDHPRSIFYTIKKCSRVMSVNNMIREWISCLRYISLPTLSYLYPLFVEWQPFRTKEQMEILLCVCTVYVVVFFICLPLEWLSFKIEVIVTRSRNLFPKIVPLIAGCCSTSGWIDMSSW